MNTILKYLWKTTYGLTGLDLSFKVKYHDWSYYLIELRADINGVKSLLADSAFQPIQFNPGETRLQIFGCDMRRVQIVGSYYEVSIQVPVEPIGTDQGQFFAHLFLPVNSEAARWAGVDINGFPKFLAQIDYQEVDNKATWQLAKDSESILSFSLINETGQQDQFQWNYLGVRRQQVMLTKFEIEGIIAEINPEPNSTFQLGSHPIADKLHSIILSDKIERAIIGHQIKGHLHKAVKVSKQ